MNLSEFSKCLFVPFLNVFCFFISWTFFCLCLALCQPWWRLQSNSYYEFLEIMTHFQYWKQCIHSGVNSMLHMSPSAVCHWPCNTPQILLVSSCNFLQATIQTTKQKRPKWLQTLIFTVKFHSSCTSGKRQVPNRRMFQSIRLYICSPQFLEVFFFFTAPILELYS